MVTTRVPGREAVPRGLSRWLSFLLLVVLVNFLLPLAACGQEETDDGGAAEEAGTLDAPFVVAKHFEPTLWGEAENVVLEASYTGELSPGDDDGKCLRLVYEPGPKRWAAVYWQPPRKAGVRTGKAVSGATKVTFWAKGGKGGEVIEAKGAGVPAVSLLKRSEPVILSGGWQQFEVELDDADLSEVVGAFGVRWRSFESENPEGLTVFLDEIRYE